MRNGVKKAKQHTRRPIGNSIPLPPLLFFSCLATVFSGEALRLSALGGWASLAAFAGGAAFSLLLLLSSSSPLLALRFLLGAFFVDTKLL